MPPLDSERVFVDLLFRASKKYASWDPEVAVHVGDYGRITQGRAGWAFWRKRQGIFVKEGNIYTDGHAEKCEIPAPVEHGADSDSEGQTWITSKNATQVELDAGISGQTPIFAECQVTAAYKFNSGRGAVLVMDNDTISTIEHPGKLRRLLDDESMRNLVVVSEVHRCSSYARLLTLEGGATVALGLSVKTPVATVAEGNVDARWVRSSNAGNFKSKVNKSGKREFYPLFRLVSLREDAVTTGLRGELDEEPPLPDAEPPWGEVEEHREINHEDEAEAVTNGDTSPSKRKSFWLPYFSSRK
ncbi:hypothetical protein B0H34DRAFT_489190 [Crassisporium funariophilum]|nr:hypothetical protein B0H34DRAFT_489190 [Crassisporium funariophilum]